MGSGFDSGINRVDGHKNDGTWGNNPTASTDPVLALMGVVGLIEIFKNKDRALLALFSIPVGIIIIAWTIAEIAFPH